MNKPSQTTNQNADNINKKQWVLPTVEVIGADIIKSGNEFPNYTEASLAAKGKTHAVTQYFVS
ncbi:hypothetical protein [Mucilaginibacter jinjuensis]|uniref:Uncharacterized protein n=1 Tax=Mucilaginibacter jinjuensis TaxID=1176721 RepID=A0ABY7T4S4_9SPHI|nr:hypothetical protein [Mucilaginibacter jinjuensis]WCT11465.1 hypothetical protein PQO05_22250 [Mucilaginibacter jinjuensis]